MFEKRSRKHAEVFLAKNPTQQEIDAVIIRAAQLGHPQVCEVLFELASPEAIQQARHWAKSNGKVRAFQALDGRVTIENGLEILVYGIDTGNFYLSILERPEPKTAEELKYDEVCRLSPFAISREKLMKYISQGLYDSLTPAQIVETLSIIYTIHTYFEGRIEELEDVLKAKKPHKEA